MLGLMVLFAFLVYLLISMLVVIGVARLAKEHGRSPRRWGWAAAVVMYLLVFWDHLPTLVLHKYYCATRAGFWVYKTPEQWKAENPSVAETLTWRDRSPSYHNDEVAHGYHLNERFNWERRESKAPLVPVWLSTESVIDTKNGALVAKQVLVWSGYGSIGVGSPEGDWRVIKLWVGAKICNPKRLNMEAYARIGRRMQ